MNNREFRRITVIGGIIIPVASLCGVSFLGIKSGILILLSGTALLTVFIYYTAKRYRQIAALNDYLVRVLAGAEVPEFDCQEEGELSILQTSIYKASTTLRYQNEQLSKEKKNLADAIADISHQLKTPLTSMMVINDLLTDEEDEEKRTEFLKIQSAQLDRMNWLIQTLLKISKLDAGTVELKKEEVSVSELMKDAMKPFDIQMEIRDIVYTPEIKEFIISCDRNWTLEALQNIIKNCIEHMDDGGMLRVSTEDTNIYSAITVKDTGCGISKKDLPHIFERFYKGKNAGKDSVGIGLALAKTIIESEHGEITVESFEGEGTQFCIKLYKTII